MKKTFAVSIKLNDRSFNGQISLAEYRFMLDMEDGEFYQDGQQMKICNIEVDLPFESVEEMLNEANKRYRADIAASTIAIKEAELERLKAALNSEETNAA